MSSDSRVAIALAGFLIFGGPHASAATSVEETLVSSVKNGPYAKLGPWLANVYEEYKQFTARGGKGTFQSRNPAVKVQNAMIGVDAYANDPASLQRSLAALGATKIAVKGPLVSARVPVKALGSLAALASLGFANAPLATPRVAPARGFVVSQGDPSMKADEARAAEGVDGTGVTVGLLSDSYRCNPPPFVAGAPNSTAAQDAANNEVPANVLVLDNGPCPSSDEGRGMAQLVHDVAPGAQLQFHTAFNSLLDFALGILELRSAGSDVIVDDFIYFAENMFSDGIVAQAADLAVADGAAYFTSAGNDARLSYESQFRGMDRFTNAGRNLNPPSGPVRTRRHDFDPGAARVDLQKIHVTQTNSPAVIVFSFQWDQPFLSSTAFANIVAGQPVSNARGATGDLDLLIYDSKGILVPLCPPGVSTGITCQITGTRNIGGDAVDVAALVFAGPKPAADFYLSILVAGGAEPEHVKYVAFELSGDIDIVDFDTQSGTAFGHANARNAESVGASSFYQTPEFDTDPEKLLAIEAGACVPGACLNDFSSAGGVPIYLDRFGSPLAQPEIRMVPGITGPDGGNTSFSLADSSFDDDDHDGANSPTSMFLTPVLDDPADELPNFFGTSASAPHVAGVAALMLDKNGGLGAQQIYNILRNTAHDMTRRVLELNPVAVAPTVYGPIDNGFDHDSGFGFVDAKEALAATP